MFIRQQDDTMTGDNNTQHVTVWFTGKHKQWQQTQRSSDCSTALDPPQISQFIWPLVCVCVYVCG